MAKCEVDIASEVLACGNRLAGKESEIGRPGSSASDKVGKQVQQPSSEGSSGRRSCPAASLARSESSGACLRRPGRDQARRDCRCESLEFVCECCSLRSLDWL